jgi:hypothetical protein
MRERDPQSGNPYPEFLYDLAWDMFALVRCWDGGEFSGPDRGRAFERAFCRYCERRGFSLSESPGSRTLLYGPSASGFCHENDAVIAMPGITVHFELKHLSYELDKAALMIFNQKGIDFLMADNPTLRRRPLYRVLLSGSPLWFEARVFAAQWGILAIEPDRIPLLCLLALANRKFPQLAASVQSSADKIAAEVPFFVGPLQARLKRLTCALEQNVQVIEAVRLRRMLIDLQEEAGEAYWRLMDRMEPSWIEDRYDRAFPGEGAYVETHSGEYNASHSDWMSRRLL